MPVGDSRWGSVSRGLKRVSRRLYPALRAGLKSSAALRAFACQRDGDALKRAPTSLVHVGKLLRTEDSQKWLSHSAATTRWRLGCGRVVRGLGCIGARFVVRSGAS